MNGYGISLRGPDGALQELGTLEFASLQVAYADVLASIPDMAADLIRKRSNPFRYTYLIRDHAGAVLLEVPLSEALRPSDRDDDGGRPPRPTRERLRSFEDDAAARTSGEG